MTGRKKYTRADFAHTTGARFLVEMVVDDSAPLRDDHLIAALPGGKRRGAVRYLDIVAILPQEIGVGDTVIHHSKALGTVRTVDDGYLAVVHTLADGGSVRYWWPAANCTLVRKAKP